MLVEEISHEKIFKFSLLHWPNGLICATNRVKQLETATFDVKHAIFPENNHPALRLFLENLYDKPYI